VKFVHFTAPNGRVVSIAADQVTAIRDAQPGEYAPGSKTVIVISSGVQAVRESRQQVEKALS
jgi:hypothetical protein